MKCKRCGWCCGVYDEGIWRDCEHLNRGGAITTCKVYANRIGKKVGKYGQVCGKRSTTIWDFPACEFNTNKKLHPFFQINKN